MWFVVVNSFLCEFYLYENAGAFFLLKLVNRLSKARIKLNPGKSFLREQDENTTPDFP